MTTSSGSRGATAAPASDYLGVLDAAILAVTGWTKVETLLVSGTLTWNVYKSAAANNSQGADFYIAIGYVTTGAKRMVMTCFEQWNTGTDLATNFPPNTAQTPTVTTWANPNAAAALPSTGTTMAYLQMTVDMTTTGILYAHSITADRIAFGIHSDVAGTISAFGYYMGLYDSMQTTAADPFPLCCVNVGLGAGGVGGAVTGSPTVPGLATREPNQTASVGTNFGVGAIANTLCQWSGAGVNIGSNETYSGKPLVSRVLLIGRVAAAFRGLLKDMYLSVANTQNCDTVTFTLNGVSYTATRIGVSSFGMYMLNV